MIELNVTPFEELDLLVKWLGPESLKQAVAIRAAYATRPDRGLACIWERLEDRFGAPEMVDQALRNKLNSFPVLEMKERKRLYDLADIVSEIEAVKEDEQYSQLLGYYDTSSGVSSIVNKLPYSLKEKWISRASRYKQTHHVAFPPFGVFANFLREISKIRNDPGLCYDNVDVFKKGGAKGVNIQQSVSARKTGVTQQAEGLQDKKCPLHGTNHSLNDCRSFKSKRFDDRKKFVRDNGFCFKCCESSDHKSRDCKSLQRCADCGSDRHPTALHFSQPDSHKSAVSPQAPHSHGGEHRTSHDFVANKCTQICGPDFLGKSCAKMVLVKVYHETQPSRSVKAYAIIDDQSNRSLARSALFDILELECSEVEYSLSSCGGHVVTSGRVANGCVIESLDGAGQFDIPTLLECDDIPNVREEIPTPNVAVHHPHLSGIAHEIPPLDEEAEILLLIGRDLIDVHHVHDQRIGRRNTPYAQKLGLGWVIIGETCLDNIHRSNYVNVKKTYLLQDGRTSVFNPCENSFKILEKTDISNSHNMNMYSNVFEQTPDDDKPGLSIDDKEFLAIMKNGFVKDDTGFWKAPLPFRSDRQKLPNNRACAERRGLILDKNLRKDTVKKDLFLAFMDNMFKNGHAEKAPDLQPGQQCWYLPVFGVFHPHKPNQIRCVFDSSAKYNGVSLNDVLLTGPDFTNNLAGILLRFRKEKFAIMADIQQMFYSFYVLDGHRDYLRFLWYEDNDFDKSMIEYRMCVHVFGNSPSPAIATYGLRKTVQGYEADVEEFVNNDFYVDDGLTSRPTAQEAVDVMKRTQSILKDRGLRLHKIASNSEEVMLAFPSGDLARELKDLNIRQDNLPTQRSLGLNWNLETDSFSFNALPTTKPYTRRGVLAVVNSIFDPLGFIAPVTVQGKLILRDLMVNTSEWDQPLPDALLPVWEAWRDSLAHLHQVQIPRMYTPAFTQGVSQQVHMYSDASERAIAAVGFIVSSSADCVARSSFLMGKAKVAPLKGHTIPRLELCAAVLSVELADVLSEQLRLPIDIFRFHCDSKVVLGYIINRSRRFHTYVSNRVERVRRSTAPSQWVYVPTDSNPADCGTRGIFAKDIQDSMWLTGPRELTHNESRHSGNFPLVSPDFDKEVRQEVVNLKTNSIMKPTFDTERFSRFSSWRHLVETLARLKHIARSFKDGLICKGWHTDCNLRSVKVFQETEIFVIRTVQQEVYREELESIRENRSLFQNSQIQKLDPYVDPGGLLRVGGRLNKSKLTFNEKNPIIIPGKHHIASLIVRFHHERVHHQGRHFTEGAVRSAGFWITGGKRLISSIIFKCFNCRKLRGRLQHQKMADLPEDRLQQAPPFTYVGVDTFGPWNIVTRRTRGGQANSKRWAILFTCLTIRAIHIEVVEEMSSSAFINALRRFTSVRGEVKEFRSDRGTNFVGACDELGMATVRVEQGNIGEYLYKSGSIWKFNPPHSSHMGGVWERMIGMTRRVLESTISSVSNLTHDVLVTLMAEVCAIVNSRPLVPVSCDSEIPNVLSASKILTFKTGDYEADESEIGKIDLTDTYRKQWKQVRHLADVFWCRWRKEYLQSLQQRRKWQHSQTNIRKGDVVLLRDKEVGRVSWPLGYIAEVFPSSDEIVRKVKVRVSKNGSIVEYVRPIVEVVLLVNSE